MKKTIALILAFVMCVSLLSACGGGGAAETKPAADGGVFPYTYENGVLTLCRVPINAKKQAEGSLSFRLNAFNPRRGRAAPLKTCTTMQVGRLRAALPLPTSGCLRRGPGGLRTAARGGIPFQKCGF